MARNKCSKETRRVRALSLYLMRATAIVYIAMLVNIDVADIK